jgi:hypothetical protein
MTDPKEQRERNGSGGSSDGDTQPDDTGATGERGDLEGADDDDSR